MVDVRSALSVRIGAHTDATDLTATPAGAAPNALADVQPVNTGGMARPERKRLRREPAHPQNKRFGPAMGPYEIKPISLDFIATGLNGNTGAAINAVGKNDLCTSGVLQALFGAAPVNPAGAADASTAGAGDTATLTVTERDRYPVGIGVLVPTASGVFARQVIANGGSGAGDLTLDRVVPGALVAGDVIRACRFKVDPSIHDHTHCYIRQEFENHLRNFKGCMSLGTFEYTEGEYGLVKTSWMWSDVEFDDPADPAVADPTTGGEVVNANNSSYIGDLAFDGRNMSIDLGGTMSPKTVNSAPQNVKGYKVLKGAETPTPKIMITLPCGTGANEIDDNSGTPSVVSLGGEDLDLGDESVPHDISLQFGTVAGAVHLWRAPAAHCVSREDVTIDGQMWLKCVFECVQGDDANFGPLELLIY